MSTLKIQPEYRGNEVQQLRREISQLRNEVSVLSSMVALFCHPARANWRRYSAPVVESESGECPTLKLPVVTDPEIVRVTIDDSPEQFVRAYRFGNHLIPKYCGPFAKVGLQVLEKSASLLWEMVEAPKKNRLPATPIPENNLTIV